MIIVLSYLDVNKNEYRMISTRQINPSSQVNRIDTYFAG